MPIKRAKRRTMSWSRNGKQVSSRVMVGAELHRVKYKGESVTSQEPRRKYPSQEDAEFMADFWNKMNEVYTGAVSPEYKVMFEKADAIRRSLWEKTFGANSPWSTKLVGTSRKAVVYWDKEKARQLGLGVD